MRIGDILKIGIRVFCLFLFYQSAFGFLNLIVAAINGSVIRDLGMTWFIYSCVVSPVLKLGIGFVIWKSQNKIVRWLTNGITDASIGLTRTTAIVVAICLFGLMTAASAVPQFVCDLGKFLEWKELYAQGPTSITSSTAAFGDVTSNPKFSAIFDAVDIFVGLILMVNSQKIAAYITSKSRLANH